MSALNICNHCKILVKKIPENITLASEFQGVCNLCVNLLTQTDTIIQSLLNSVKGYEFNTYRIDIQEVPIIATTHLFLFEKVHDIYLKKPPRDLLREHLRAQLEDQLPDKEQVIHSNADIVITVDFSVDHPIVKRYGNFLKVNMAKRKRNKISRENLEKVCRKKNRDNFISFKPTTESLTFDFRFWKRSMLLGFNYNKYSRKISHSNSFGKLHEDNSVEEIIANKVAEHLKHDGHVFVSCGREDIDVLMLGNGRPAVLELKSPLLSTVSEEFLQNIENDINGNHKEIKVTKLRIVGPSHYKWIKSEAELKDKSYRCVVWSEKILTKEDFSIIPQGQIEIKQWTPLRVLHRRPNLERTRYIKNMRVEIIQPHWFVFYLTTQAGTYVKEFCHSDRGRTSPSLGGYLGTKTVITQLDVMNVHTKYT